MSDAPKHTAGPWERDRYGSLRGATGREVIAHGIGIGISLGGSGAEALANGQLIVAAPDLLKALRFAEEYIASDQETDPNERPLLATIRAAIAKAEGRS